MKILVQDKTVIINSERYCAIGTENNNVVALVEGSEKTRISCILGKYASSFRAKEVVNSIFDCSKDKFKMPED